MLKSFRSFLLVVLNLVAELWTGFINRTPGFYDRHTVTKTRTGYVMLLALVFLSTVSISAWLCLRVYG